MKKYCHTPCSGDNCKSSKITVDLKLFQIPSWSLLDQHYFCFLTLIRRGRGANSPQWIKIINFLEQNVGLTSNQAAKGPKGPSFSKGPPKWVSQGQFQAHFWAPWSSRSALGSYYATTIIKEVGRKESMVYRIYTRPVKYGPCTVHWRTMAGLGTYIPRVP